MSTVSYLESLRKNAPKDILKISTSMAYAEERKYVKVEVPEELALETFELYHLTDVQWGHKCCNRPKFIEYRDFILEKPNRFTVFGGDMIDASTMLSKGTPWENDSPPIEQIYEFVSVVMPLRSRIIGYVGGNHERHTRPTLGRSAGSLIATNLEIPYSEGQQFIDVYFGEWKPFKIHLWHGSGSSVTPGAKMQKLCRFMEQGDSHLYLMGHLHDAMVKPAWRIKRGHKKRAVGLEKIFGCLSSSFLEIWGTYAEVAGLPPTDTMMARCILSPDSRFEVTLK